MSEQLKEVRHDIIRYANCWEDADILLSALDVKAGERVFSIGSAGDNSFSLLTTDPELVLAVDINEVQLNLIQLKKACFKQLNYSEFLEFLGFHACEDRKTLWLKVRESLSEKAALFWENRWNELEHGIIFQGKFEKYFKFFRKRVLPFIHSKQRVDQLLQPKSAEAQKDFFDKKWNTWRWRGLFKIFFSKFVMGRFGRDPEFLSEVKISVSKFILNRAEKKLSSSACQNNYLLHFIMKGYFGDSLPHYAREENFHKIKKNINKLQIYKGFAEQAFEEHAKFNVFNLSNIFEYMEVSLFQNVSKNLVENALENARFAYWNLMVPRFMNSSESNLIYHLEQSKNLGELDKGFFYSEFILEQKK